MFRIRRRIALGRDAFQWDVEAPALARAAQAGQFVIVRLHPGGERIPLTIADFDRAAGTLTLVVGVAGRTTRAMRDGFAEGDAFPDLAGPLGIPSEVRRFGHVVAVGGGFGVASLLPQVRAFKEAGNRVTALLGFKSADRIFWEERFAESCDEIVLCTEDGSRGRRGLVTAPLMELVAKEPRPDRVVAIGPIPMMRACAEATRAAAVPTVASLNAIMVDGTGMCGSCRVTIGDRVRFACSEGPEFDAHAVDFAGLERRQARFRDEERRAREDDAHACELDRVLFVEGRRNYKRIRELAPQKTRAAERDAALRARDFDEVSPGYQLGEALAEAERCLQCARPTCIEGCPVRIDIPRFIRHLLVRDLEGARAAIEEANLFPSICGRVCPQEHQCEAQCVIGRRVEPVAIGLLERFVGDRAPRAAKADAPSNGHAPATTASPGRVAIVGSGPAGLACAADLARAGAQAVVFEALHEVGGVLRYGIPSFRLPRDVIAREVERLRELGVEFRVNHVIGQLFTLDQLLQEQGFDAAFVATGAGAPIFLGIPGEDAAQVLSANEFLTRVHLMGADGGPYAETPLGVHGRIAVVGAGNTAMDCMRTALRLHTGAVHGVYRRSRHEAPARREELEHAEQEGVRFHWLVEPREVVRDGNGDVRGLLLQRMALGEPDESGRRRPLPLPGETELLECDSIVVALGTKANPLVPRTTTGLATDRRGHVVADPRTQATNLRGVFAGGDLVTGDATVILAMGAGRRAAASILEWLATRAWPLPAPARAVASARLCPRCRRPLEEDDGEALCCADQRLTWRCTGCQKVSEGFALPYGRCAACGGALVRAGATPAVDDEEREVVRAAFEIELGGADFYRWGARQATEPDVRRLFAQLAALEQEHVATLARRYHLEPPVGETSSPSALARASFYAGVRAPADPADPAALLALALALERKACDLFRARVEQAPPGSRLATLCRELQAEEEEHAALITTELELRRRGRAGVLQA